MERQERVCVISTVVTDNIDVVAIIFNFIRLRLSHR